MTNGTKNSGMRRVIIDAGVEKRRGGGGAGSTKWMGEWHHLDRTMPHPIVGKSSLRGCV